MKKLHEWRVSSCARFLLSVLPLLAMAHLAPAGQDGAKVLFDFEKDALGEGWTAGGDIRASREPAAGEGATGQALRLAAGGSGGVYTKSAGVPADWSGFSHVTFRACPVLAAGDAPVVMEVQVLEADGRTRFWRKIELARGGWQSVEVRLAAMRWSAGRVPQWDAVSRLGFYLRGKGEVWIDDVAVRPAGPRAAQWSPKELALLAFGADRAGKIRPLANTDLLLLSDAAELDPDKLAAHLAKVAQAVYADFPQARARRAPVALLVFADRKEYRDFTIRLANELASQATAPKSDGYTLQGIATSYYDDQAGTLRPTYTHEYVHALLGRTLRLQNSGEWLQEGLAVRYQLRFHPQANVGEIIRQGLGDANFRLPLATLCNGRSIPMNRYWQAMTVADMLLGHERYAKRVPALLEAVSKAGSTDLGPHLQPVLETSWERLETDWRVWCEKNYRERNR